MTENLRKQVITGNEGILHRGGTETMMTFAAPSRQLQLGEDVKKFDAKCADE